MASSSRLYAPLRLHQSWVTDIQFSRDNIHMVTVGDKIAWWCLDHLPRKKTSSAVFSQRSRKTSVPTDTYNPFQRRRRTSESNTAISPGKYCCVTIKLLYFHRILLCILFLRFLQVFKKFVKLRADNFFFKKTTSGKISLQCLYHVSLFSMSKTLFAFSNLQTIYRFLNYFPSSPQSQSHKTGG